MTTQKHILDDKITFRELVQRGAEWIKVYRQKWKFLFLALLIGASIGLLASWLKKPVYTAETTFVIEESDGAGMGNLSGLASLAGINLGSLGSSSGLFQGDNIMELYRSDNMLSKTLLSPFDPADTSRLLVHRYIDFHELDRKWKKKVDFGNLDFNLPREQFTIQQDSVIKEIVKGIRQENLSVNKPDRKLSIIRVTVNSKDEDFAKIFNERLVENVNQFYFETKTKKTAENLSILQSQADSIRRILDSSLADYATLQEQKPHPNPLLQSVTVEARSKQIDVQAAASAYSEMAKNLEIAKINHRNSTPLIQIIDNPRYPLTESKIKWYVGMFMGGMIAFILAVIYIYVVRLYQANIRTEKA